MPLVGHTIETTTAIFSNMVINNRLLVDKTLMIKEFIEGKTVSLITRPRRFGKTLNMSMLQHFLSTEVIGIPTAGLFDNFAIAKVDNGEFLKKHQGQYPVIFITFKDTKETSFESTINQLRDLIQELYREHTQCLLSEKINQHDKVLFQAYLEGSINDEKLQKSLKFLSEFLFKVYNKKVIMLIDEYDTPLTHAYQYDFLEPLGIFMRDLFSAALKDNAFLEKGLMTGIVRISQNNMLSGLNNLKVYTLLDPEYRQYFGFTEEEIKELVHYTQNDLDLDEIKAYYNGYNIGDCVIYNPWSTMQCLDNKRLDTYWVATSNDKLLSDIFVASDEKTKAKLAILMQKKTIEGLIDINLRYQDLMQSPDALWTLLLFCGYLTVVSKERTDLDLICQLRVPNREILAQYRRIFHEWLTKKIGFSDYSAFLKNLLVGNINEFSQTLSEYLLHSFSFRDVGNRRDLAEDDYPRRPIPPAEKFYHGFVMGLIASIQETHWVDSNKESGLGLYDVMITPKDERYDLGIILEFKYTKKVSALKKAAEDAIKQIHQKEYDTILKRSSPSPSHVKQVLKVGLAFCEKSVSIAHRVEDL